MIRIAFAIVIAALAAATARADYALYYTDPSTGRTSMTMKSPNKAYLEKVAADLRKSGQNVTVKEYVAPGAPAVPGTPAPTRAPSPAPAAPPVAPPATPFTPGVKKMYSLQSFNPTTGQYRTIMQSENRAQLERTAQDYQRQGISTRIVESVVAPPTPPKDDPMPATIPLIGVWGVVDTVGGDLPGHMQSYSIEITSVKGTTFYYTFNFQKCAGTFDPVKKTITLDPQGMHIRATIHFRNGRWVMTGGTAQRIVNASAIDRLGDWTASRQ